MEYRALGNSDMKVSVISQGSWEAVEGKVDLILANLVPSVLLRTGSGIPAHLNEQGRAIISGFGQNQSEEMEGFFADFGLLVRERLESKGWRAFVMERNGSPKRRVP
ncbi:MAG: 50S ribosomal protein L11 methyltransferase [Deltaproteobacteria bacterium]|nr:50S ribosomal protein L11 methyltransferase [Deltaproteobacteria bacterium]